MQRHLTADPATTIIVFAHGSRLPEANASIARLAAEIARQSGIPATAAFLEIAQPDLGSCVAEAVAAGARRIVIAPAFLTVGRHATEDLPRLTREQQKIFPGVEIVCAESLEGHPALASLLLDRVSAALQPSSATIRSDQSGE